MGLLILAEGGNLELANPAFGFMLLTDGEHVGISPPVHTIENIGYVKFTLIETGRTRNEL